MSGSIVTFYSYKGGAGRTMALANAACLLAAAGYRVLAIDWDLEAPGLHRYLHPFLADPNLTKTPGIIDLMWDYAAAAARTSATDRDRRDPLSLADPTHVATPADLPLEGPDKRGCLHIIGAGMQNTVYADRVRNFDWAALFSHLDGASFVRRFGEKCRSAYDFTLIDSRTGIADTAGIATIVLPDRVVLCFTPNRQSVLGIRSIGESIMSSRPDLRLLPVVTRVEKGVEGWREAQIFYRSQLDGLLPDDLSEAARAAYWGAAEIVHYPNYALNELLATFCDAPTEQNSLLSDMRRMTLRISESEFMSSRESFPPPEFSAEARRHYLRRIQFRDPRIAELQRTLDGDASSGLVTISRLASDALQEFDQEWLEQLAHALNILGIRLSNLARHDDALIARQQAVALYRSLANTRPELFLSELASSLNELGSSLSNIGRLTEALSVSQEAIEIRRRLAQTQPDTSLANLASNLNDVSVYLFDLGRRKEAQAASREAIDLYRLLAEVQPDIFLSSLAMSLNNLSNALFATGDREEALTAIREVVDIYRSLAQTRPDSALRELAVSLNVLSNALSELGRYDEALTASQEAVDVYRRLAQSRPDASLRELAMSLNNISGRFSDLGRREEALATSQEAVEIYRLLSRTPSDPFRRELAASLENACFLLNDLGRHKEAAALSREALSIRSGLEDERELEAERARLHQEYSDLDAAIEALQATPGSDIIRIQRLKKRKLQLRDRIAFIEDQITPDIIG
jgi:tetratricopeptide (TPR) repeat protein